MRTAPKKPQINKRSKEAALKTRTYKTHLRNALKKRTEEAHETEHLISALKKKTTMALKKNL